MVAVWLYFLPVYNTQTGEISRIEWSLVVAMWLTILWLIYDISTSRVDNKELTKHYYELLNSKRNFVVELYQFTKEQNTDGIDKVNAEIVSIDEKIEKIYTTLTKKNISVLDRSERVVSH